jgi:hypothetical protein
MPPPYGEYMVGLEDRVVKLERNVEGLQIQARTTSVGSPDDRISQLQSHLQQ